MIWTAFIVAVAYQFFLLVPALALRSLAPGLSFIMLMGFAFILAGLLLYGYLQAHGVAAEVTDPGDVNLVTFGMAAGAAVLSIGATMILSGILAALFGPDGLSVSDNFAFEMMASPKLELIFTVALVGPVIEEMIYRGLLMGVLLARGWAPMGAAGLAALIFALQHIQYGWIGIVSVGLYGFVFGLLRIASGGLFAPVVAHLLINLISIALN